MYGVFQGWILKYVLGWLEQQSWKLEDNMKLLREAKRKDLKGDQKIWMYREHYEQS